jgi:hypothetical protein
MKELQYLISLFQGLAAWIKVLVYLLLSAFVIAIAGYYGPHAAIIAAIICLSLGIFLILASLIFRWLRNKRAAELRGELSSKGTVPPDNSGMVEVLRNAFHEGIEKFKAFNKDYYELPWFVLVGENGNGKSQSIISSQIELPTLLHEKNQGMGPTTALDWWFTNYSVILDTAGGIVFAPSDSPVTPQWMEFVALLKKHRRKCPLNGLILTISLESLLRDSPVEVDAKAGVIARHFDMLQVELGARLPVFILVTKCDLLAGFSSFFSDIKDEKSQNQMLGWSNPAPLEAPFRPELVGEHFHNLVQRLRRRRLGSLLDPVPSQDGARRIDEVDTMFSLPENLQKILPNLNRYVENIFVAGQWSFRPHFLRGIYLTSADGAETSNKTSSGSVSSRFLRDVFLDKIFREDALVTSAGTGKLERYHRILLFFTVAVVLLAFLFVMAFFSYGKLAASIYDQIWMWKRAAIGWNSDGWMPVVKPDTSNQNHYIYQGHEPIGNGGSKQLKQNSLKKSLTLNTYHEVLARISAQPIEVPLIFKFFSMLGTRPDSDRLEAQKVLFENSVVRPLLLAARTKMSHPPAYQDSPSNYPNDFNTEKNLTIEAKALTELVRVEAAIVARSFGKKIESPGSEFIHSFLEYVSGVPDSLTLSRVMNWTYDDNAYGIDAWAPQWASGGNSFESNTAIDAGTNRLVAYAQNRLNSLEKNLSALQVLADSMGKLVAAEQQLAKASNIKGDFNASQTAVANAYEGLESAKIEMEKNFSTVKAMGLFEDGPETLNSALGKLANSDNSHLGQVDVIIHIIDSTLPAPPDPKSPTNLIQPLGGDKNGVKFLQQIKGRLNGISGIIQTKIKGQITDQLLNEYKNLDYQVLNPQGGMPCYLWRWNGYGVAVAGAQDFQFNSNMYLVGQHWNQLQALNQALDSIQANSDMYTGSLSQEFLDICSYFLKRTENFQIRSFMNAYVQQAKDALLRVARFPLVWPPGPDNEALGIEQLQGAQELLQLIASDIKEKTFTDIPTDQSQQVLDFAKKLNPLYGVLAALIKPDGQMSNVNVTLYNGQAQKQLSGPNFTPLPSPTPTPTQAPRSLMNKMFAGSNATPPLSTGVPIDIYNWNAVGLASSGAGVYPIATQSDISLGLFLVQDPFSFRVYHSLMASDGSELVNGGTNWSALRLIARLGAKPVGIGQDWQVALKPNEPNSVWIKFSFALPLPPLTQWPTIDSLGLSQLPDASAHSSVANPFSQIP